MNCPILSFMYFDSFSIGLRFVDKRYASFYIHNTDIFNSKIVLD